MTVQISDWMGQYRQTKTPEQGKQAKITGTKGVENLASSLRSLTKGNIFEGTVSSMKNGRVTLALSSGQQISARVDGKVSINVGESMFFQVKSNDGVQIAIRPFVLDGTSGNYTLMQALTAAGLPTEPDYLSMVNRMMQEQMPIDKGSLNQMARIVNANPDIDVQTIVQLNKLGILVTRENAVQFENYLTDRQAITAELDSFMEELPKALAAKELPVGQMRGMGKEVLSILTENLPDIPQDAALQDAVLRDAVLREPFTQQPGETDTLVDALKAAVTAETAGAAEAAEAAGAAEEVRAAETAQTAKGAQAEHAAVETDRMQNLPRPQIPHTLGALFDDVQLKELNQMIGKLLGIEETAYGRDSGAAEVLKDLQQVLGDHFFMEREPLHRLFSSKQFAALLKDSMEQQWLISPKELSEKPEIRQLYERLDNQMQRLMHAVGPAGHENTSFAQAASDIRGNLEFMNQINQIYTYVQIPLKMSGQNASGELYVYTNKKNLAEKDGELSAFLHLDMKSLGPTDVSVRLLGHNLETNFYLESDEAYAVIEKNIPVLEAKLAKKGYHCKTTVINEKKHVNFVEDFLKKDQPSAGKLHRYSFDMRA